MNVETLGPLAIIHLIVIVWAGLQILKSNKSLLMKILWIALIALFPVGGLIIYLIFGR